MPTDTYRNFAALAAAELSSTHRITACSRPSPLAVIAPHGSGIEPGASELARAIGCQLEVSNGLRRTLFAGLKRRQREHTTAQFEAFVAAVRTVLLASSG